MKNELVLVIDFGGQYNQLIARRVRECHVYCEVIPYTQATAAEIKKRNPIGIIFTGGPNSVYEEGAPKIEREVFSLGIPVLGICYGAQLMAHVLGGTVKTAETREYGKTNTFFSSDCKLFSGLPEEAITWMST